MGFFMKRLFYSLIAIWVLFVWVFLSAPGERYIILPIANLYFKYKIPKHKVEVTLLKIRPSSIEFNAKIDNTIHFETKGYINWFRGYFNLPYRVWAKELEYKKNRYKVNLNVIGKAIGVPYLFKLIGKGNTFGGKVAYILLFKDKKIYKIQAKGARVEISNLLILNNISPYISGLLDISIDTIYPNSNQSKGDILVYISSTKVDRRSLKKELKINLPPIKDALLNGKLHIERGEIGGDITLNSPIFNLSLRKIQSNLSFSRFKSRCSVDIADLSALKGITPKSIHGHWQMQGVCLANIKRKYFRFKGQSSSLGGKSRIFYENNHLKLALHKAYLPLVLDMLRQRPVVDTGTLDGEINFKDISPLNGTYNLKAKGIWNRQEFIKLTSRDIGGKESFSIHSKGNFKKSLIIARGDYKSSILTLLFPTFKYEWSSGAFEGKYTLKMLNLHNIELFSMLDDKYRAKLSGKVSYLPILNMIKVSGKTKALGGVIEYFYKGNNLQLKFKGLNPKVVSKIVAIPIPFTRHSSLQGSINFKDLISKKGDFKLKLKGILNNKSLKELYNINLEYPLAVKLISSGIFEKDNIQARASIHTKLLEIIFNNINYQIPLKKFHSGYTLKIADLSYIKSLIHHNYRGPLNISGKFDGFEKINISGVSSDWGGSIIYSLEGDVLQSKGVDIDLQRLMWALNITPLLDGKAKGSLIYNTTTKEGILKLSSNKVMLVSKTFSSAISLLLHKDITKEYFSKLLFNARIGADIVHFNFNATSPNIILEINDGKIDRAKEHIDAILTIKVKDRTYHLKIYGSLKRIKLGSNTKAVLQTKILKVIENKSIKKEIKKVIPKEIKNRKNHIKKILKGLF